MVKNDNTKLASTSKTAPINGILNSIWSKSLVELNNTPINSNTDFHYMKYFFTSLIDSTRGQTIGPKSGEGYYWDDASLLESRSSPSFTKRSNLFKKNNDYTTDEVCFAGILYHDLITCKTGVSDSGKKSKSTFTLKILNFDFSNFCDFFPHFFRFLLESKFASH